MEACGSKPSAADDSVNWMAKREKDEIRVMRKAVQDVFERCQRALELLNEAGNLDERDVDRNLSKGTEEDDTCHDSSETDEIYDMIKSQVVGPEFLQKIVNAQASVHLNTPEGGSSWDMIYETDLWEGGKSGLEQEDYVLVRKEDIVEGITCFMAEYLLSLEQTKDLTPNQLQDALRKTFSLKKRKGKLRKAWDGSKVIYNVASWSATAIGIYQNPVLFSAASTAFWTSCRVLSKFF